MDEYRHTGIAFSLAPSYPLFAFYRAQAVHQAAQLPDGKRHRYLLLRRPAKGDACHAEFSQPVHGACMAWHTHCGMYGTCPALLGCSCSRSPSLTMSSAESMGRSMNPSRKSCGSAPSAAGTPKSQQICAVNGKPCKPRRTAIAQQLDAKRALHLYSSGTRTTSTSSETANALVGTAYLRGSIGNT